MRYPHVPAAILLAAALTLSASPASAFTWELGLKGIGVQQIQITNCNTGQMTTYTSHSPVAAQCNVNFGVDFNGTAGSDVQLQYGVPYVFRFVGWNKSIKVVGDTPDGSGGYDGAYNFTNNSSPPTLDTSCFPNSPHSLSNWPSAACPPPPPPGVSLTLGIESQSQVGDKTIYVLKATASGGSGSYTFSWSNANMSTAPNVNPSKANRAVLRGQDVTVSATVNDGVSTATKSITLHGGIEP